MNELTDHQKSQLAYYESVSEYETYKDKKQNSYHNNSTMSKYYQSKHYQFDTNPNLEKDIALTPQYSFLYAKNILKSPFPLGEPEIADSVYYLEYSISILKSRFKLAENKFLLNDFRMHSAACMFYLNDILKINHE